MKRRLLQSMTMMVVFACATAARADVTPPDEQVCMGHAPGDACITTVGTAGTCLMQVVHSGPPDSGQMRTAVVCTASSSTDAGLSDGMGSESQPATNNCGCTTPGRAHSAGFQAAAIIALGLFASRRRRRA